MSEDEQAPAKATISPNPRRGERRSPKVIEGTAQSLEDLSPNAESTAMDPRVPAEPIEPPSAQGSDARQETLAAAGDGARAAVDPQAGGWRTPARGGALSALALVVALLALAAAGGVGWRVFYMGAAAQDALRLQVAALATRVGALEHSRAAVGALTQRVAALAASERTTGGAANKALEQATAARAAAQSATQAAAALKSSAQPGSAADVAALDKRINALEQRPDPRALQAQFAKQSADAAKARAALDQKLASLDQRLADLDGRLAAQAARLTPLEALLKAPKLDVAAIQASNARAVKEATSSALIVVARSLQKSVDSGGPFAPQIAAAQKLGAESALLQKLQVTAATGVATAAVLKQSFEPLSGLILAGVDRSHATGFFGRLTSRLGKLVRVRTIGQPSSGDRVALVGQIEGALARGDVEAALAARDKLPANAKAITQKWAAQAQARVSAQQAAQALLNDAVDRLGKART